MSKFLDLLLRPELPDLLNDLPKKQVEVPRLSGLVGEPVVFELHGLPYGRVQDLQKMSGDTEMHVLLAGCDELRAPQLMTRYNVATPAEALKRLLLPGEVADLSREVEKLCGFRMNTIKEVKNELQEAETRS